MTDAPGPAHRRDVGRPLERVGGALEAAVGRERGWVVRQVDRAAGTLVIGRQRLLGRSWTFEVSLHGLGGGRTRVQVETDADAKAVEELLGLLDAEIADD